MKNLISRLALAAAISALLLSGVVYMSIAPEVAAQVSTRFRSIQVDHDANVDGNLAVAGTTAFNGDFDLNGNKLDLDADADTSLTADTDDQIDFEIGGADEVSLTAAALDINDTIISQEYGAENIGITTVATSVVTYTAAAGGSFDSFIVGSGETWLIHKVFFQTTTSFDATGDDVTLDVGTSGDADGFLALADASLQSDFTEDTGFQAGFAGIENGSAGAFTTDDGGPFVIISTTTPVTITTAIDETSGETITDGEGVLWIMYTRLQ